MKIIPLNEDRLAERTTLFQRVDELKEAGSCPTCYHNRVEPIYPANTDRVFHEDELVQCFLELYPRNPGHTIVLVKPHFDDFSLLSPEHGCKLMPLLSRVAAVLQEVLDAEKVYMNTMCDGRINHLHYQLIPRFSGDEMRGSELFVKMRDYLLETAPRIMIALRDLSSTQR